MSKQIVARPISFLIRWIDSDERAWLLSRRLGFFKCSLLGLSVSVSKDCVLINRVRHPASSASLSDCSHVGLLVRLTGLAYLKT